MKTNISSTLVADIRAGFSVFLLALPLCIGISIASLFPPAAGLLTAIIAGLVATFFGSAPLTIKGPAAGLIAICLAAVTELSVGGDLITGYKRVLAVGVVAAILQIIFSVLRLARLAEIMPPSIIHGMLAGIGVIIIVKQSYVLLGVKPDDLPILEQLAALPGHLRDLNPTILLVGVSSIVIALLWPRVTNIKSLKALKLVPASMVVLVAGVALSIVFDMIHPHDYALFDQHYHLSDTFLIRLPESLLSIITFPDFSQITSFVSIKYILMFALVGSIESLLTVCAADKLDPNHHHSDLNRDLMATGVGNLVSSLLGGLPMISEIVRSRANIDYGGKTQFSNFFHGLFLLLALVLFSDVLKMVPLSALAALLILVGLRLASIKEMIHVLMIGAEQLLLFLITLFVTLKVDLLAGVFVGIVAKLIIHIFRGAKPLNLFRAHYKMETVNGVLTITLRDFILFSNFLPIYNAMVELRGKKIRLDFTGVDLIDHSSLAKINDLVALHPGEIELPGLLDLAPMGVDPSSTRVRLKNGGATSH